VHKPQVPKRPRPRSRRWGEPKTSLGETREIEIDDGLSHHFQLLNRESLLNAKLTVGDLGDMLKKSIGSTVSVLNVLPHARRGYPARDKVRFSVRLV
jgi:hypothetical protein